MIIKFCLLTYSVVGQNPVCKEEKGLAIEFHKGRDVNNATSGQFDESCSCSTEDDARGSEEDEGIPSQRNVQQCRMI